MNITDTNVSILIEDMELNFIKDTRLLTLFNDYGEFEGLYQYIITCNNKENSVVLKRALMSRHLDSH